MPSNRATRRRVVTVRAMRFVSPLLVASAIWRTPLLLIPIPAIVRAKSAIEP